MFLTGKISPHHLEQQQIQAHYKEYMRKLIEKNIPLYHDHTNESHGWRG
jgi:putative NIF3 family GTP cyclohydrolase 1 type 2